jgi:hypothetical protein
VSVVRFSYRKNGLLGEREVLVSDESPPAADSSRVARGVAINEDWAATIIGLTLLVLVLVGVIPTGVIP